MNLIRGLEWPRSGLQGMCRQAGAAGADGRSGCRAKARSPLPNKEHCLTERDGAAFLPAKPDKDEIGCERLKTRRRFATMRLAAMPLGSRRAVDLAQQLSPPQ